jgi:hypothetical protein
MLASKFPGIDQAALQLVNLLLLSAKSMSISSIDRASSSVTSKWRMSIVCYHSYFPELRSTSPFGLCHVMLFVQSVSVVILRASEQSLQSTDYFI